MKRIADRLRCGVSVCVLTITSLLSVGLKPQCGADVTSGGSVIPVPPGNWDQSTSAFVGYADNGWIEVTNGTSLNSWNGSLGYAPNATGEATLVGNGTSWVNVSQIVVGVEGVGKLEVKEGAGVSSASFAFGLQPGSSGEGLVVGAGSSLSASQALELVNDSILHIQDGGLVASPLTLAGYKSGSSVTITITDGGTLATDSLFVGGTNTGTNRLAVDSGGVVHVGTLFASPNDLASTNGGTINANGVVLDTDLEFTSGHKSLAFGNGGTLDIVLDGTGALGAGYKGVGTVTITDIPVESTAAYLGYHKGAEGVAVVTGNKGKWDVPGKLHVGYEGEGSVTITVGSEVNAGTMLADVKNLKGGGTVNTAGVVLDGAELLIAGTSKQLNFGNNGKLNITPTAAGTLGAGHQGKGSVTVTVGIQSGEGLIGNMEGSEGAVTITKSAVWTIQDKLSVGHGGHGHLVNGGQIEASHAVLGYGAGSVGTITLKPSVGGDPPQLAVDQDLTVGGAGEGALRVPGAGVKVVSGTLHVGRYEGGVGTVTVTNGGLLQVAGDADVGKAGTGSLVLANGGTFQAKGVFVNNAESRIRIDAGTGSKLVAGDGSGTFQNFGTVTITIPPTAGEASVYKPIESAAWSGPGGVVSLGGTWNQDSREITASAIKQGVPGAFSMDISQQQRASIHDLATNWTLGLGFMGSVTPDTLIAEIAPVGGTALASLQAQLPGGAWVAGAWDFDFQTAAPDVAYLSFDIGTGHSSADLRVWHSDGSAWMPYNAWDLTYAGSFASFAARGFSAYAVTIIPEPTLLALLAVGAAAMALARSPRKRQSSATTGDD